MPTKTGDRPRHFIFEAVPTQRQVVLIFVAAFTLQLIAYRGVVSIQPSADDFILPVQIRVGEAKGPLSFFLASPLNDYRPLQSLVYWAVGRWALDNPFPLIHVLNFASFAFFASIVAAWTMQLRMSLGGSVCAALLLSLHPVLAGPLADLDGFTRMVVSGWVWLGTFFAVRFANDLRFAVPLVGACFLIGLGFMEYALGLIPLSILGLWWARRGSRLLASTILGTFLLVLFASYYLVRAAVVGSSAGRLTMDPIEWARNFALMLSGVGFLGNTVWVYFHQGAGSIGLLAAGVTLFTAVILAGFVARYRMAAPTEATAMAFPTSSREAGFLITAFFASFTPMVLMTHVSEIYVTAIVVALALVTGRAAEGWSRLPRPLFISLAFAFVMMLGWAFSSTQSKVAELRATGDRAAVQLEQLLRWLPPGLHGQRVALVFLTGDLPDRRTYSVFRGGDDHLLQPGYGVRYAIEWTRPGSGHVLEHFIVRERSLINEPDFDLVLYWNPRTRLFERWK